MKARRSTASRRDRSWRSSSSWKGRNSPALNGGPQFKFDEAISFQIACENQQEVDYFWSKLTEGGKEIACGWLKDKFGLSWKAVPAVLYAKFLGLRPRQGEAGHQRILAHEEIRHRRADARV